MEQFERLKLLVGDISFKKISNVTVLVIGLGGVGSYAVESLVRSGIKKIILVDFDKIDITNLNRQIMTSYNNVGVFKTEALRERIKQINSYIEVKCINEFIDSKNIDNLFAEKIDYVIDACDTIETKKSIIRKCLKENIKFISSMGMGNRIEPSKICITDIRKTSYDPIAKILRKMVKEEKINKKIPVVWSNEQPIKTNNKIGSNSFVPACGGLFCSSFIINDIVKEDFNERRIN